MARREEPWRYWVDYNHLCIADPKIPSRPFRLVVPADAYDKLLKRYEALKKNRHKVAVQIVKQHIKECQEYHDAVTDDREREMWRARMAWLRSVFVALTKGRA